MVDDVRNIALDIKETRFFETYRIQAYHGVIQYAQENPNWRVLINHAFLSLTHKFNSYDQLAELNVRGVIFSRMDEEELKVMRELKLPAVSLSHIGASQGFPSVRTNDEEIGQEAAEHFLERGFQSFACLTALDEVAWEIARANGFRQRILGDKHTYNEFAFSTVNVSNPQHQELDKKNLGNLIGWLEGLPKPVGIFATNDSRAFQILETCKLIGLSVPRHVAIVGVDNNAFICNSITPSISSVEPNAERVGYEAAKLLDGLISGEPAPSSPLVIPPKGIATRVSSDMLAIEDEAVSVALLYIRENFAENIGVNDIAEKANVSRTTLQNRFRSLLGMTISDEIARQRLCHAKTLLLNSDLSVEEVSRSSGFRRANYFWSFFLNHTGLSPSAWREKYKEAKSLSMEQYYGAITKSAGSGF